MKPNVDAEECERIRDLRREGRSLPEIAVEVGRSRSAVVRHARAQCGHSDEPISASDSGLTGLAGRLAAADPDELTADP